jgi:hypothetical protein
MHCRICSAQFSHPANNICFVSILLINTKERSVTFARRIPERHFFSHFFLSSSSERHFFFISHPERHFFLVFQLRKTQFSWLSAQKDTVIVCRIRSAQFSHPANDIDPFDLSIPKKDQSPSLGGSELLAGPIFGELSTIDKDDLVAGSFSTSYMELCSMLETKLIGILNEHSIPVPE